MPLIQETEELRHLLRQWATDPEWSLLVRYELLPQKPAPEWRKRLSWRLGRCLRVCGLSRARYCKRDWQAGLKHVPASEKTTLLIWSDVPDKAASRVASNGLRRLLTAHPAFVPVLVTPLADFAFYSRLGWLIEYLPEISGAGADYIERKKRYLAWRYRDAVAIPLSSGLCGEADFARLVP